MLAAEPISEAKASEKREALSSVLAFSGDGFLGSLSIFADDDLIRIFAEKMMLGEAASVSSEMVLDLMAEVSAQIVGAVRNGLSEYGYKLLSSLSLVVYSQGDGALVGANSSGRYYTIPFRYEDFRLSIRLCYNSYKTSIHELEENSSKKRARKGLDIRLCEAAESTVIKSFSQYQVALPRKSFQKLRGDVYIGESIQVVHLSSWQGKLTIGLEFPRSTQLKILESRGFPPDAVDDETINDFFAELLNLIASTFVEKIKEYGYSFQRVYHGKMAGSFEYTLKNPGLYFREELESDVGNVTLLFGADSEFAGDYFDAWPYFAQLPGF